MSSPRFNVLISAAGRRVALLNIFRRTLHEMGLEGEVLAADSSRLSSAFHAADRAFVVPRCTTPEFIPAIEDVCRANSVRLVVPTIDPELPAYAEARDRLRGAGTEVAVSSPETVRIGGDKCLTHEWLTGAGLPTVEQVSVPEIGKRGESMPFPLVVKPRWGSGSIGMAIAGDSTELEVATRNGEFVAQAPAPGDEYTIDVLADARGTCLGAVPRRRIEVRAGEVSKGVTVRSEKLEDLAKRVCEALPGAFGPLTIQMFMDGSTGEVNVIEINPRFAGGFPLSSEAGANYPRRMIEEILDIQPKTRTDEWRSGLLMLRYDEGVFVDASAAGL